MPPHLPSGSKRHSNGGGWVSITARVAPTAYVAPHALVDEAAEVRDDARIEGHAVVKGRAIIKDGARVRGHASVSDDATVGDAAVLDGSCRVSGSAMVAGNASIGGQAQVDMEAYVHGWAMVAGGVHLTGHSRVGGNARLLGDTVMGGFTEDDGDGPRDATPPAANPSTPTQATVGRALPTPPLVAVAASPLATETDAPAPTFVVQIVRTPAVDLDLTTAIPLIVPDAPVAMGTAKPLGFVDIGGTPARDDPFAPRAMAHGVTFVAPVSDDEDPFTSPDAPQAVAVRSAAAPTPIEMMDDTTDIFILEEPSSGPAR